MSTSVRNHSVYAEAVMRVGLLVTVGIVIVSGILITAVLIHARKSAAGPRQLHARLIGILLTIILLFSLLTFAVLGAFDALHVAATYILSALCGIPLLLCINVCLSRQWIVLLASVTGECCLCCRGPPPAGCGGAADGTSGFAKSKYILTSIGGSGNGVGGGSISGGGGGGGGGVTMSSNGGGGSSGLKERGASGMLIEGSGQHMLSTPPSSPSNLHSDQELTNRNPNANATVNTNNSNTNNNNNASNAPHVSSSAWAQGGAASTWIRDAAGTVVDFWRICVTVALRHKLQCALLLGAYLLAVFLVVFITQGACFCSNPTILTTWVTRRSERRFCTEDAMCHVYPMLGVDASRMRLVAHVVVSGSDGPSAASTTFCPVTLAPSATVFSLNEPCSSGNETTVAGRVLYHAHITEDRRYLSHTLLTNLQPLTYYRATVRFTLAGGAIIAKTIIFRTIAGPTDMTTTVKFLSGGDFYSGNYGVQMLREALVTEPHPDFFHIGGDLSYSNNMRTCYIRMDFFVDAFSTLRTNVGTSIPLLIIPGNHESGGYGVESDWSDYYYQIEYFPHYDEDTPSTLLTTHHRHVLSGFAGFVALDSGCMEGIPGQVGYMRDALTQLHGGWTPSTSSPLPPASTSRFIVTAYHNPAYPSLRAFDNTQSVLVRTHFVPVIEQYKVPLVLEFHDHAYKRTAPILQERQAAEGKGVVYVGDGGIGIERDVTTDSGGHLELLVKKETAHNLQVIRITPAKVATVDTYSDGRERIDTISVGMQT